MGQSDAKAEEAQWLISMVSVKLGMAVLNEDNNPR